jgi:hypothetical protein
MNVNMHTVFNKAIVQEWAVHSYLVPHGVILKLPRTSVLPDQFYK